MILLAVVFLILCYALSRFLIKYYFKSVKDKYAISSNYISKVGLGVLLVGFITINPTIYDNMLNYGILITNQFFNINIPVITTEASIYTLILYSILCIAVVVILRISYKRRERIYKRELIASSNTYSEKKEITIPDTPPIEDPILVNRIKELFELKYKNYDLKLEQKYNSNILYGTYHDPFHRYIELIYCEDEYERNISIDQISTVFNKLHQEIYVQHYGSNVNDIVHCYYILKDGNFNGKLDGIRCLTEDAFISELIDFRQYLKKMVHEYKTSKIFSAISNEENKKTLSETFISPNFSFTNPNKKNTFKNLSSYIDEWMLESSNKHLILLADYGMGKTSFLKYFSARLAEQILDGNSQKRYPVFISLNNTSPIHGGISKSLRAFVSENLGVNFDLFQKLIHKGKILFILDAFDEMGYIGTHDQRFKQFNEIWQLATINNKILMSGRPSYFPSEIELIQNLNIPSEGTEDLQVKPYNESLILKPLDPDGIKSYIAKYYSNKSDIEKYYNWIISNRSIHDLCRRPSMMHIIREMLPDLLVSYSDQAVTSANILNKYIEYWIDRQDSKKILSAFEDDDKKKKRFIINFYSDLAVEFHLSSLSSMDGQRIIERLHKTLKHNKYFELLNNKELLNGFESEILSGYFIEIENDLYKFVHKSFYEYFVAIKIISLIKSKKLNDRLIYSDWSNEIVDFIYDSIPEDVRRDEKSPALLTISNSIKFSKVKNYLCRKWLFIPDGIESAVPVSLIIITVALLYILIDFSLLWGSLLFPVILIVTVIFYAIAQIMISERINGLKWMNFVVKAYKIAFIKKQFKIEDNTDILLKLLSDFKQPFIPLRRCSFDKTTFVSPKLYIVENVKFSNCSFFTPLFRSCQLKNVDFSNSRFNGCIFTNSELKNVKFDNIIITSKLKSESMKAAKKKQLRMERDVLDFRNCNFDSATLGSITILIERYNLKIGEDVIGDEKFIETINNMTKNKKSA